MVTVRVLEVDVLCKRISLSTRKDAGVRDPPTEKGQQPPTKSERGPTRKPDTRPADTGSFGSALLDAMKQR